MITAEVSTEQLAAWKTLYQYNRSLIKANSISGRKLDEYFQNKYRSMLKAGAGSSEFEQIVVLNARENGARNPKVVSYNNIEGNVLVGIDLESGYFQVECEDTEKMALILDDLFLTRGLSGEDLSNYVIVGQYLSLLLNR